MSQAKAWLSYAQISMVILLRVPKTELVDKLNHGNGDEGGNSRREKQIHVSSPSEK
jgi:hypothetical protein